jgi:quercetin dioxygenase-like cupin family protein
LVGTLRALRFAPTRRQVHFRIGKWLYIGEMFFMATTEFTRGSVICSKGEPFRHVLIITKGTAEATLNGHTYAFGQGDMLGFGALSNGTHSFTYTATSDMTLFTLPYDGVFTLQNLFREKEDIANVVVSSMIRQAAMFLQNHEALKREAVKAYDHVTKIYSAYEKLCALYAYTAKKLPAITTVSPPTDADKVPNWAYDYYMGISELENSAQKSFFSKTGVSLGFVLGGADEILRVKKATEHYQKYIAAISKVLLSDGGFDLFSVIAELHVASAMIPGADAAVEKIISPIISLLSGMSCVDEGYFKQRVNAYRESLTAARGGKTQSVSSGEKANLADSLSVILKYSGYPEENANKFARTLQEYIQMSDRGSSDDGVHRLRRELTNAFNEIYKRVFMNSLNDFAPPTIIKMFLNFGYMDATLAGHEYADFLYSIADSLRGDPDRGIYTAQEWLTAIYTGKKDPCRNEFDMDYAAHVAELKQQKRFDDKEEARLLADNELKLIFEIDNIFPVVNKLTFGRITTFCPIFSDNNVQRGLEDTLVTPKAIFDTFKEIREVDFSAFYREIMYSNPEVGVPRETVNVEIMPEVILMPNVGVRGIMWQEIEGRKRTTHARMFAPIFLLTDLKPLLVRLTGEFRWEMCKRVQGSRWQDITEASLTSEYCDYLQFYRTNRDLSPELKVGVKQELSRARNNYKSVFVSNYSDWILYEANGSPRLNKIVRKIMMNYCTLAAHYREALSQNPQFAESLKRFNFQNAQRIQYLERVIHKISHSSLEVPQELTDELNFVKS